MPTLTRPFDPSEYLDGDEAISAYLEEAFEGGDPRLIAAAIGDVAKARGMTAIARDAGLSRESLYKALSEHGNPALATVVSALKAMGLELAIRPAGAKPTRKSSSSRGAVARKREPA